LFANQRAAARVQSQKRSFEMAFGMMLEMTPWLEMALALT